MPIKITEPKILKTDNQEILNLPANNFQDYSPQHHLRGMSATRTMPTAIGKVCGSALQLL